MSALAELKYRGVADVFVVCDGLKGLPDSVEAVPQAAVQTRVIHCADYIGMTPRSA